MQIAKYSLACGLILLAACSSPPATAPSAAIDDQIACATTPDAKLEPVCTVERSTGPEGLILTLRHPDGGFRRLVVTNDGRGVIAADGAEQAIVSVSGADKIEVSLAGNRYLLPATIKGAAAKS
jgi:hypothetical protein